MPQAQFSTLFCTCKLLFDRCKFRFDSCMIRFCTCKFRFGSCKFRFDGGTKPTFAPSLVCAATLFAREPRGAQNEQTRPER